MPSTDPRPARPSLSRRGFLQTFALLGGGLALTAACGQQAPAAAPAKPAETKPTDAAKPAEAAKPAAAAGAPVKGGTLRIGLSSEAVTMDPHLSGSKIDRQ